MAENVQNIKKGMPKMSSYVKLPCFLSYLGIQISLWPFPSDYSNGLAFMWHIFKRGGQAKCGKFKWMKWGNKIYKLYYLPHDPFCEVTFKNPFFHWHNPNTFSHTHARVVATTHPWLRARSGCSSQWSPCVYCTVTWFSFPLFHGTAVLICTITL